MSDSQSVSVPSRGEESNNPEHEPGPREARQAFPSPLGAKSPTICIAANGTRAGLMRWFPSPLGAKSPTITVSGTPVMGFGIVSVPSRGKESNHQKQEDLADFAVL